jgi:hypothetical protein
MAGKKPGRNAPCRCGSGRKYKKCHLAADERAEEERNRPAGPRPREYWELLRSVLPPPQVRSDEVGPDRE